MKLNKFALISSTALLCVTAANAAFIQSSSLFELDGSLAGSDRIILNGGTPLTSGFVASGTFGIDDATVTTLAQTSAYQSLIAGFALGTTIGTSDFTNDASDSFGLAVPGAYVFAVANFNETPIIGQTLYTFMGNGATLATSTHLALYRHGNTLAADPAIPPETNYDLLLTGGTLLVGTAGTAQLNIPDLKGSGTYNTIGLQIVPEPSAAILGAVGALGLLRRRRN